MIELDSVFIKEMVEHGLRAFPNEACGVIAGVDGVAVKVFPMRNADASAVSYRLDPTEQLHVFDEIDRQGWDLFGIFHTHTHSDAVPSETDRRLAFYPESRYLIVSLLDRENPVVRAFTIVDGDVREEELALT
jgi:[CysO sulfur-carrier protein]-S-L-cysteine hydrolase